LLLGLAGSALVAFGLLGFALFFSGYIVPGLFMFEKTSKHRQRMYISLGTTLGLIVGTIIILQITILKLISDIMSNFFIF